MIWQPRSKPRSKNICNLVKGSKDNNNLLSIYNEPDTVLRALGMLLLFLFFVCFVLFPLDHHHKLMNICYFTDEAGHCGLGRLNNQFKVMDTVGYRTRI